ncbi:MAG: GntR family transcriptional regulator [Arthrobacter sp.]
MKDQVRPLRSGPHATAYLQLREWIIAGDLAPESQLSEPELAKMLGFSRTPVREALTILVADGLVVRLPTGRAIVAPLSVEEIQHVYDVRSRLEGLIARDASLRISSADRAELERKVVLMERLSDDYVEVVRIGADFHRQLEEVSGNVICSNLIQTLRGHVDRYRAFTTREPGRSNQAASEHRDVFEAVMSGVPDRAEATMRLHIDQAGKVAVEWAEKWLKSRP